MAYLDVEITKKANKRSYRPKIAEFSRFFIYSTRHAFLRKASRFWRWRRGFAPSRVGARCAIGHDADHLVVAFLTSLF